MTWLDQAEGMINAWSEAQKKSWQQWNDLTWGQKPSTTSFTHMGDLWQELVMQGMRAWTGGSGETAQHAAERLFAGQNAMMRFIELSTNVWKAIAQSMETGQDWQAALNTQMEVVRGQLRQASSEGAKTGKDLNTLWRQYLEQMQVIGKPWMDAFFGAAPQMPQAIGGDLSALAELTSLYWDTYDQTFGRFLQSPALGYTREADEKMRRGFAAWLDLQQASYEYEIMLSGVWAEAFEQLIHELMALSERGEGIQSLRQLLLQWTSVADRVFMQAFRSEKYIQVQGQLVNASMAFRLRQREIMEEVLRKSDLPTRSDVDEANHEIYKLRKEVKALKQALASLTETIENGPQAALNLSKEKPARARRAPAKSRRKQAGNNQ